MSKIIERIALSPDYEFAWVSDMIGEMKINDNGKTMYISISSMGWEDSSFYISEKSIIQDLIDRVMLEKYDLDFDCIDEFETGNADQFGMEESMKESPYYKCFLYLFRQYVSTHQ